VTIPCLPTYLTYLEQELVFGDSLHRFEEVGLERELVAQVELDGLEESLVLRVLAKQSLRVGPVLTVHRVQLELLRLKQNNNNKNKRKQANKHIHSTCDDKILLLLLLLFSIRKIAWK